MKELPFNLMLKGLRIPFVAAWEKEPPSIAYDPCVKADAVYSGQVDHRKQALSGGLGKVLLGQMSPQRQRYVMVHGLCQVCGKKLITKVALGIFSDRGPDKLPSFDEPPCCAECALIALEMCPHVKQVWEEIGGFIVVESSLYLHQVKFTAEQDRTTFTRGGLPLARNQWRRYLGKTLVMHVRLKPSMGIPLHGIEGRTILEILARREAEERAA